MSIQRAKWSSPDVPYELQEAVSEILEIPCLLGADWIAGGAIRSRIAKESQITDWDCYFRTPWRLKAARKKIEHNRKLGFKESINDAFLCSYKTSIGKVDLVRQCFANPVQCLESFDFTCACFALDAARNVYWLPQGLEDLKAGILRLATFYNK